MCICIYVYIYIYTCIQRRARGCSLEIDPNLITPNDNLLNNVNDLTMHASLVFEKIKKKVPKGLGNRVHRSTCTCMCIYVYVYVYMPTNGTHVPTHMHT